jgi:hypothetical protein
MKKIIIIVLLLISSFSFSQEAIYIKNNLTYKTKNNLELDSETKEIYEKRLKYENIEIEKVIINENEIILEFKKETSPEKIEKTLLYVSIIFGYKSFKIKNEL